MVDRNAPHARKKKSSYWKFIEVTHARKSGRDSGSCVIIILLKLFFLGISWSCIRAYRGAGHRWKSPLDCATDFLWKIWQHISAVNFVSVLIFCFCQEAQKRLWTWGKWGLKIVLLIWNMHGLVITRWMLEKDRIVTPTLQRDKNYTG